MSEPQREKLNGIVSTIIFMNEDNGYSVLEIELDDGSEFTAAGCAPGIMLGEVVELEGYWTNHARYGRQFKFDIIQRKLPEGIRGVIELLSSGIIKGIGIITARRLVDEFGADTLNIIDKEPEKLTKIKGITRKRADAISEAFHQQLGMRRLMEFLTEHEMPLQVGMSLYKRYGTQAIEAIEADPYILVSEEFDVPFSSADKLAIELDFDGDDPLRLEAGILYELQYNLNNGHTFIPRNKLIGATSQLLTQPADIVETIMDSMLEEGMIIQERIAGEDAVYLFGLYEAENYIAQRIIEMTETPIYCREDVNKLIQRIEKEQGILYADQQKEAIRVAATNQVMLLTGGPGTGKTTSLKGILSLFDQFGLETALAAPTGRAAKRLGELCDQEAFTIHRLLETKFDSEVGQLVFSHDENDPIQADAIIVDETSMVDVLLMRALISALRNDARLILVGDPNQLPSVGPGNVLYDMIASGKVPTVELTEIFRQATESDIIMNAHSINNGVVPQLKANKNDFFLMNRTDETAAVSTIVELCCTRLPRNMGIPSDQIQVISPTKKGICGTINLNKSLQAALNPKKENTEERVYGETIFRVGDRVMQVKNNYDTIWRDMKNFKAGMGVFNGDIGVITEIEQGGGSLTVDFDGRLVDYTGDMLNELELAYAVTVHKSQGSEYRAVILVGMDGPQVLMTRGVLYTAVTRARELLIVVGKQTVVENMIFNNKQNKRYSGLRYRLTTENA